MRYRIKSYFILILFAVLGLTSCKEDEPAPALSIISIKSGTIDLNGSTAATNVSVSLPIVVVFSTKVDVATATSSNIILSKGTLSTIAGISVVDNTVTITPTLGLSFGATYSLVITKSIKSDKGVSLSSQISLSFTTDEPAKVYISQVIATPTESESITLKNNSGGDVDISGWTLGDQNDPVAYKIPVGTILVNGQSKTFSRSTLGFAINDSGEFIYLKNSSGVEIDRWTN